MIALLDVNVLIALAWPNHLHHRTAMAWFRENRAGGWATCPVTEAAFVRVSANARILDEAKRPAEARELLREVVRLEDHVFWGDDLSIAESGFFDWRRIVGHRQVTDAHLVALSLRHDGRVATFDSGLRDLVPEGYDTSERIELVVPA